MNWRRPNYRWQMRAPTRFPLVKSLVLAFFTVLVLAPATAWVMSLPMWAMDTLGYLLASSAQPRKRWFGAAMLLAGVPSLAAVGWRAWRDRDLDAGVMAGVATVAWLVLTTMALR